LPPGRFVCAGNVAYYHALNLGGKASTVVPLTALYPLVTVVLAMIVLRERMNGIQLAGIALSLLAIWLFNVAGLEGMLSGWLAYALVPIALWGAAGLLQKVSTNHISGELSTLWFLAAFVPVALVLLLLQPLPQSPPARVWILVGALGLLFSLGNFALLLAFAGNGKASVIAPLAGLYPLVSVPVAILFLDEKVGRREWLGILVALVSVVALSHEGRPARSTLPSESPL
jgi:drug/metabolite transporter (DMT)-like permease